MGGEWENCLMSMGFDLDWQKYFGIMERRWLNNTVKVLDITELFTLSG